MQLITLLELFIRKERMLASFVVPGEIHSKCVLLRAGNKPLIWAFRMS